MVSKKELSLLDTYSRVILESYLFEKFESLRIQKIQSCLKISEELIGMHLV